MSSKITSPIEGFTGPTSIGSTVLNFEDGTADVDNLSEGARAYLLGAGYTVDGDHVEPEQPATPVDSRDLDDPSQVGTKLRDAAVDPHPDDFLAPVNAGDGDPHGPEVVSPEVHASQGVRPVKGGDVHVDDTDAQDSAEKAHTEASTDGTFVADGSVQPAGNGSLEDWQEYARSKGATDADLDGKGRNDLRDTYGS